MLLRNGCSWKAKVVFDQSLRFILEHLQKFQDLPRPKEVWVRNFRFTDFKKEKKSKIKEQVK